MNAALLAELGIPADYGVQRGMPFHPEATDLVVAAIAPDDGSEVRLAPETASAWTRMQSAAAADGITLWPLSGFRSIARQAEIIRRKLQGETIAEVLQSVAAPGYSEHHTGRAIDIGCPEQPALEEAFEKTAAYAWLGRNAARFGFTLSYPRGNPFGIAFEPWHWFYGSGCSRGR